ncbi:glycosyltransferase family 61 protein [Candidatus Thioglobus sp.]|nr:glycosyltransferase family 61 protein [Candidatus Thioglobus sp.]
MQEDIVDSENLLRVFQTKNISTTPAVINFSQKSKVHFVPINLNICKFNKATITFKSDIIRIGNSCYWYKFHSPLMYKTIPADADLVAIKDGNLFLEKEIFDNKKIDSAVSLIGARDHHWSHFLVQYYPKLEILKKYLHNVNITVVISEKLDRNSKELINSSIPKGWKIYELKDGCSLKCEELYYVDNTSWLTDHSESFILGDTMVYEESFKIIKNMVDNIRLNHSQPKEKNRKIYLRRAGKHRGLTNSNEVDKLLEEFGFEVINGHEYSMIEKLKIFSEAKIIVGPLSSGFVNAIFSESNTKLIAFTNKNRVWDTYIPTLADYFNLDFKYILSSDEIDIKDPHSSYSIDIAILKEEIESII